MQNLGWGGGRGGANKVSCRRSANGEYGFLDPAFLHLLQENLASRPFFTAFSNPIFYLKD